MKRLQLKKRIKNFLHFAISSSTPKNVREKLLKEELEQHAYSVRQLIAQRSRLFATINLAGQTDLKKVLDCIETTQSQFLADIFCLLLNGGKENGFFVEFGACDGRIISNTSLLESQFGWKGILSEPSVKWQPALRDNRKCAIETRCVWSASGEKLEFVEAEEDAYGTQSAILKTAHKTRKHRTNEKYLVESITLADMLREHSAPKQIDFISIDTEGSEYEILKAFPFDEYKFGFMAVEHLGPEEEGRIKTLLESVGYKQVLRDASGHDGFYVPANT
ncbi:MAG: FkbM family methyltransferase [Bdellovibrionales bacterium]|nr:FkbM family methyltransferase [Bdellovibrionales bacterium]